MSENALTFTPGNTLPWGTEERKKPQETWNPTPEEKEALFRIKSRYENEMLPAQAQYHKEWDEAKTIYECVITPDPLKETFKLPISHMVIDAALAEEIDAFPDFAIDTQEPQDRQKLPLLNAAKKYALLRANWEKVKMEALRIRRIYGWCAMRISYSRETRKIKQRVPIQGDSGIMIGYREVIDYPWDDIRLEVIDNPRRFLIGDMDTDIDDAEDCALVTDVSWDSFKIKVQHDTRYKNINFVHAGWEYGFDIKGELVEPTQQQNAQGRKVRIIEYWNKHRDEYVMMANNVIIRQTCLLDDHKELPFAVLHMHRRPHSFYSKGIPKLIESIEAAYNSVMQAEVRATKLAFPILVTDDDNAIDPRQIAPYPGVVLEGGLDRIDLKQLGSVPNEVYRLKDKLEENLIWLTGINFKQIFSSDSPSQMRVGIEALKKESMLARVNANLRENEANFIVRLGQLLLEDIMQYFPTPKVRRLMPEEETGNLPDEDVIFEGDKKIGVLEMRKIPVEGMLLTEEQDKEKGVFSLKHDNEKGRSYIIARPEYIRCYSRLDIQSVRPSAMGSSKEARKLTMMELSDHAIMVNQAAMQMNATPPQIDPNTGQPIDQGTPGEPIWDLEFIEEQLAEAHDLPLQKALVSKKGSDQEAALADLEELGNQFMQTFQKAPQPTPMMQTAGGQQQPMNSTQQNQFLQQTT